MLQKLEKYADNLENIVQQRTAELYDEKQKTDMLLYRMLPQYDFRIICKSKFIIGKKVTLYTEHYFLYKVDHHYCFH